MFNQSQGRSSGQYGSADGWASSSGIHFLLMSINGILSSVFQIKPPDNVIRPIPLRPTYTVHLITHDQDDQADKSAPDHPVPITEEAPGIPVKLDNVT